MFIKRLIPGNSLLFVWFSTCKIPSTYFFSAKRSFGRIFSKHKFYFHYIAYTRTIFIVIIKYSYICQWGFSKFHNGFKSKKVNYIAPLLNTIHTDPNFLFGLKGLEKVLFLRHNFGGRQFSVFSDVTIYVICLHSILKIYS